VSHRTPFIECTDDVASIRQLDGICKAREMSRGERQGNSPFLLFADNLRIELGHERGGVKGNFKLVLSLSIQE
jgi:hypothetical protein